MIVLQNRAAAERNSPTVLIKDKKPSFDCPVVVAYGEFDPPKLHKMSIDFAKVCTVNRRKHC